MDPRTQDSPQMVTLFNPLVSHLLLCTLRIHIKNVNTIINASFYVYLKDLLRVNAEFMMNVSVTYNLEISAQQNVL